MKVKDILDKVDLFQKTLELKEQRIKHLEDRIKHLEDPVKKLLDILEERPQLEVRFDAQRELYKILEKRFEELEHAHPTICKGDYSQMFDEPREVIPHHHKGGEKR